MLQLSFDGWTIWPCQPASVWNCRLDGWSPLWVCSWLAQPRPCIVHFVGDLGPSKWEFWRCEWWKMCVIYQNICFGRNCLYVANVTEFIAAENGPGQERLAKLLFFLSIACENIRFSSLFAAGDVSRGGTSPTQWQKFLTDDVKICPESGHKSWLVDGAVTLF